MNENFSVFFSGKAYDEAESLNSFLNNFLQADSFWLLSSF